MRFIKFIVTGLLPLVRRYPALLSSIKWLLKRFSCIDRLVRYFVGRSLETKPSTRMARLSNADLRILLDLKQAVELYRNRTK